MLGGNVETNAFPVSVDGRIVNFIRNMVKNDPMQRPSDAWKLWHELSNLRLQIFGDRHQFLEFIVPGDQTEKSAGKRQKIIKLNRNSARLHEIKVKINGILDVNFILDSGSSEIALTPEIFDTLERNGSIKPDDYLAAEAFQLADGRIIHSKRFNIRTLEIDNIIINNVAASISSRNDSPLLLGQNVIERIGIFKIDYAKDIIIIE
jgi:predicted aspartyl protease